METGNEKNINEEINDVKEETVNDDNLNILFYLYLGLYLLLFLYFVLKRLC